MALTHLVDTSALKRLRDPAVRAATEALAAAGVLARPTICDLEFPDLLVAAAAEEHRLTLVHYDANFDLIASVTGQRCQWVVPAGSTD